MDSSDKASAPLSCLAARVNGFDFTGHMRMLCADIVARLPDLAHVKLNQVAIVFSQTRKQVDHGLYATLTPMRFEAGKKTTVLRGRQYATPQFYNRAGEEILYILSFYLPRFQETDFNEKLVTVFHELWHISPEFNGDLRRYPGRCYAHSHSQKQYDNHMQHLVNRWLKNSPPQNLYKFLCLSFQELVAHYGSVYGARVSHPKLIPLASFISSPHKH